MDTGCKFDLTTRASVPPCLQDSIMKAIVPITLSTANDLVNGDLVARQQTMEFNEVAEPYILDLTPDVFSIWGADALNMGMPSIGNPTPWHLP